MDSRRKGKRIWWFWHQVVATIVYKTESFSANYLCYYRYVQHERGNIWIRFRFFSIWLYFPILARVEGEADECILILQYLQFSAAALPSSNCKQWSMAKVLEDWMILVTNCCTVLSVRSQTSNYVSNEGTVDGTLDHKETRIFQQNTCHLVTKTILFFNIVFWLGKKPISKPRQYNDHVRERARGREPFRQSVDRHSWHKVCRTDTSSWFEIRSWKKK